MTTQQMTAHAHPVAVCRSAHAPDDAPEYELVEALSRVSRLVGRLKAEFAVRHPGSAAEFGAMSLLIALVDRGPLRAGTLADSVLMDPSQVSRRVAALVRAGLVERRADFADGRAILLAATPAGEDLCTAMMAERARYLRDVVDDWSTPEIESFVTYLDRFASRLEQTITESSPRLGVHVRPDEATGHQEFR